MNNKEYQQIIDEVWKKYGDSHWIPPSNPNGKLLSDQLSGVKPMMHNKESFIKELKSNPKFANKWGLKIETRELSLEERNELLNKVTNRNHKRENCFSDEEFEMETFKDCKAFNIPTKLITITYNDKTIEVYE